jgi:hypothetical protein
MEPASGRGEPVVYSIPVPKTLLANRFGPRNLDFETDDLSRVYAKNFIQEGILSTGIS